MTNELERRRVLQATGAALGAGLAGCMGGGGQATTKSTCSGDTYDVGSGDYQTSVCSDAFPDTLRFYAVQTGWSNWSAIMDGFKSKYGVSLYDDQRTSGGALKHLRAHAQNPTYSGYYGGYTFAINAKKDGLTKAYKPANWDKVPDNLKTDDGHVTGFKRLTTAVTYRKDIYDERGLDAPKTWEDLKNPDIAKDLVLQTPDAAVGLACALSINNAYGGSLSDVQPVIDYYKDLKEKGATFSDDFLPQFNKGEYATFVRYDYSGLRLKYNVKDLSEEQVGVGLLTGPNGEKGAFNQPYGYTLIDGGPNTQAAKLFMDYVLSLEGQRKFLDAFVRPVRANELEMPDEFPPQKRYKKAEFTVDYKTLVDKQEKIIQKITRGANL